MGQRFSGTTRRLVLFRVELVDDGSTSVGRDRVIDGALRFPLDDLSPAALSIVGLFGGAAVLTAERGLLDDAAGAGTIFWVFVSTLVSLTARLARDRSRLGPVFRVVDGDRRDRVLVREGESATAGLCPMREDGEICDLDQSDRRAAVELSPDCELFG